MNIITLSVVEAFNKEKKKLKKQNKLINLMKKSDNA